MTNFIGVDVGGTTSTICLGDHKGRLIDVSDQFATRSEDGPTATVDDLAAEILLSLARRELTLDDIRAVTLATPGPATIDGVLHKSPNLKHKDWDGCPIRQRLQSKLRETSPTIVVRYLGDGQAAALGEFAVRHGDITMNDELAAKIGLTSAESIDGDSMDGKLDSLFLVAVGTGFGGGEVRERQVVRGRKGRAGHAGHLMLPEDAFRYAQDRNLKVGNSFNTVESAVSLTALTHQLAYRLTLPEWSDHVLHSVPGSAKDRAKRLRELAAADDPLALQLFDDQAKALGITLLMIQYMGDFDALVIGGGVCDLAANAKSRYLEIAKQSYHDHALDGFRGFAGITYSRCGDQASVIGAYVDAMGS